MARRGETRQDAVTEKASYIDAMPEWVRLTAAYWTFPIARNRAEMDLLMKELHIAFGDRYAPNEGELADAVRYMAGPEGRQAKCPTLREVIIGVRMMRKGNDANINGMAQGQDPVSDVKTEMLKARTWLDRWNIMCQASFYADISRDLDLQEIESVNTWASQRWNDWDEQTYRIRAGFAPAIRNIMSTIARDKAVHNIAA